MSQLKLIKDELDLLQKNKINKAIQALVKRTRCGNNQATQIINDFLILVFLEVVSENDKIVQYRNGWKLHRLAI